MLLVSQEHSWFHIYKEHWDFFGVAQLNSNIRSIVKWNYLFPDLLFSAMKHIFFPDIKYLWQGHHFNEKLWKGETVGVKIKFKVVTKMLFKLFYLLTFMDLFAACLKGMITSCQEMQVYVT